MKHPNVLLSLLAAVVIVMVSACASTPPVLVLTLDGAASVSAGFDGVPPLEVDSDGAASVRWTIGQPVAEVNTSAGACVVVRWAAMQLAQTCGERSSDASSGDGSGSGDGSSEGSSEPAPDA